MDTFECYYRKNLAMTTINKAAATVLRQAQQPCDRPHHSVQAVGLSYHGSRINHSRIANADIQTFRIANSKGQETIETRELTSFEHSFVLLDGLGQAHVW